MKPLSRSPALAAAIAIGVISATTVRADDQDPGNDANRYVVTNLVSDLAGKATTQDPVLRNAWGVAFTPAGSPFWVVDNGTGCATLYDGTGVKQTRQVAIPLPGNVVPATDCVKPPNPPTTTPAAPTGIVWNPAAAFLVPGTTTPALFIFDTEDGTLSAWAPTIADPTRAVIAVDNSKPGPGAVYKGLTVGVNAAGVFLFATNFRAGTIDVFGPATATSMGLYAPVTTGGFNDPDIPAGFAPFGIQNINGDLFVTYAKQNAAKHDDVAGKGNGFVDVYDTDGKLLQRFASRGALNSPWGVARASFAFGRFSGEILIGNFGDGRINVFDSEGHFEGQLQDADSKPIVIDGLWTLTPGGGAKSSPDPLFFTAGPTARPMVCSGRSPRLPSTTSPDFSYKPGPRVPCASSIAHR